MLVRPPFYVGAVGYPIDFAGAFAGTYMHRTSGIAPDDAKKITLSFWIKPIVDGAAHNIVSSYNGASPPNTGIALNADATIEAWEYDGVYKYQQKSNALYRDPNWLHIHWTYNSVDQTATITKNGVEETYSIDNLPDLNDPQTLLAAAVMRIGYHGTATGKFLLAEFHALDGIIEPTTSFGEFDLLVPTFWKPKRYSGAYGTNGCYLDFADDLDLGKDVSGNANHWTNSGVTQTTDTPTYNFATFNPLVGRVTVLASPTKNNTKIVLGADDAIPSTLPLVDGVDMAIEIECVTNPGAGVACIGLVEASIISDSDWGNKNLTGVSPAEYRYSSNNLITNNNVAATAGNTWTTGDTMAIRKDASGNITFYKNGVAQGGNPSWSSVAKDLYFAVANNATGTTGSDFEIRVDPADWQHTYGTAIGVTVPNLPEPENKDVGQHFKTVLYTGNGVAIGSGGNPVTGVGFQPDFVWIKKRSGGTARNHRLYDSIRGATKYLSSVVTDTELTEAEGLNSFDTDGFTVGSADPSNGNTYPYVAWCARLPNVVTSGWGGSPTITPSKEIYNAELGMSIVKYTGNGTAGATIPHSLGVKPGVVIIKSTTLATDWIVGHESVGWTQKMLLNLTNAAVAGTEFNNTDPTTQLVTLGGTGLSVNNSGAGYIAYIFAESDFIKFPAYSGNGVSDGPFDNLMLSTKFSILKSTNVATGWYMLDGGRSPYNPRLDYVLSNTSAAESASLNGGLDYTSTGLKLRQPNGWGMNNTTGQYAGIVIGEPMPNVNGQ
jgi:hypothetical protein